MACCSQSSEIPETELMKVLNHCSHSSHFAWFSELFRLEVASTCTSVKQTALFLSINVKKILSLLLHTNLKIGDDVSTVILNCPSSLMSFFKTVPPNSLFSIFCLKQEEWMDEWVNEWTTITSIWVKNYLRHFWSDSALPSDNKMQKILSNSDRL